VFKKGVILPRMANLGFAAPIAAAIQEKMMTGKRSPTQFGFDNPPPPALQTRAACRLRRILELIDFEPFRDMAAGYFAEAGRPSIDPVVMIKMMLLGYLFDIPSDRQLVDECADRNSFREFLGFGISESIPVHSNFTHWRQRLGEGFFRRALHQLVMQCAGQGMKLSGARTVDATTVKAQADKRGPIIEVPRDADVTRYVEELFATEPDDEPDAEAADEPDAEAADEPDAEAADEPDAEAADEALEKPPGELDAEPAGESSAQVADESTEKHPQNPAIEAVETADGPVDAATAESVAAGANDSLGKRRGGAASEAVDEPTDQPTDEPRDEPSGGGGTIAINRHDPDARLQRKTNEVAQFRYNVSFSADAESGLICDASADAWERAETAVAHVDHDPGHVEELAADGLYDSGDMLAELQQRGVTCYVPRIAHDRAGQLSKDEFAYDAERDVYICPEGAELRHTRYDEKRGQHFYTAQVSDCRDCPLKAQCTPAKRRCSVVVASTST
jgi:transposase